jgi:N-acetylglucosaminyl-diphospho-decaprenol L-rhamnosyltransferase
MHCTVRCVIAAVVVTFSAPAGMLDDCVASLRAAGTIDLVIVVDTGGRAEPSDPDVLIISVSNRGYGAAANVGFGAARAAGADMIALLNDDVVVGSDWISPLVDELTSGSSSGRVGAVQPMLVASDLGQINSLGVRIGSDGAGVDIGLGEALPEQSFVADLELFTGGAVLFSSEFLESTGGFDERYFLYYEDVDLARRGTEQGWTYRVATASVVEHVGGVSTGALPERTRYLQERNRLWAAFRFADVATIGRALWLSVRRLRHRPFATHAKALAAGLGGAPRRLVERARARSGRRSLSRGGV